MLRTTIGLLLLAVLPAGVQASDYPMLDELADQAALLKAKNPDQWKQYREQAERVFSEHQELVASWRKRSNPPRPDLKPLKLPLAFPDKKKNQAFKFVGTDAHYLLGAMMELDLGEAYAHLARYVYERVIPDGIRFLILESLATHRYQKTPELIARWLAEERPYMKQHLRKTAKEKWGDYGRAVLEEAEQINALKMQPGEKATNAP